MFVCFLYFCIRPNWYDRSSVNRIYCVFCYMLLHFCERFHDHLQRSRRRGGEEEKTALWWLLCENRVAVRRLSPEGNARFTTGVAEGSYPCAYSSLSSPSRRRSGSFFGLVLPKLTLEPQTSSFPTQHEEALIFSDTSGSDLATRKRSRPPPSLIKSTALRSEGERWRDIKVRNKTLTQVFFSFPFLLIKEWYVVLVIHLLLRLTNQVLANVIAGQISRYWLYSVCL